MDLADSSPAAAGRVVESSAQHEATGIYQQKCFVRNQMQGNNGALAATCKCKENMSQCNDQGVLVEHDLC